MKKAVHFGAGSIGRGFIADLLHDSGYEIVFIDLDQTLIDQINKTNSYNLYLINDEYKKKTITNVSAVSSKNKEQAIKEIASADIITTSVWADNLSKIAPLLLEGLKERERQNCARVNILACENAMFNSDILKGELLKLCRNFTEESLLKIAAFPNTAVDRMVLVSHRDSENTIDIGSDFELVIEQNKLVDASSEPIHGAIYTDYLEKYIERKLYIINCGHAWAGYMGHIQGLTTMQQIFYDENKVLPVKEVMMESAGFLAKKYGFSMEDLEGYIDFAIKRFQTPGITDTISRVSRAPIRKLQKEERLVGPCLQCESLHLKNNRLIEGIAAAFLYDDTEDEQSVLLQKHVKENGIEEAVTYYTGIGKHSRIFNEIISCYHSFKSEKK